jgi:hypothetical protein
MTRHLALGAALAAALFFTLFLTTAVEAQTAVSMWPNDEKEICSGVKATVTPVPKFGELRTVGDANGDAPVQILYRAKHTTTVVTESLTCTVGTQKQSVSITVTPASGFSTQAYPDAFKALFLLLVLAIFLESALAILFNWRPFVEIFNSRAVKPVVSLAFALFLVYKFRIDLISTLAKLINPTVPPLDDSGRILTAMVIAGGSSAVNNLMVGFGFRQQRTPEQMAPKPPANKGWISVSIVRSELITGPVTVAIGVENDGQIPVVSALSHSTTPGRRFFFRDRGRFPGSGGYAVEKGANITVKASADRADGSGKLVKDWGPEVIADGAIIDLTFTMTA